MEKTDDDQYRVVLDEQVGEGHRGKDHEAHQECLSPADDIGQRPRREFEEYARYRRNPDGEPDGLRPCAEIEREERQHRAPGEGIGKSREEADGNQ